MIGREAIPFEVQIRTREMDRNAEYGIAAHWKYKAGITAASSDRLDERLAWVRQLLESQRSSIDATDLLSDIKSDLLPEEVFAFTPRGDVINLPAGATVIDFAYAIHSAVGNRMIGAKVNEVLFKGSDPCGKYIRVNGIYYQVVGVTKQRASSVNIGGRAEESVFLPFSTMQQTLNQGDIIHFLCVSAKPGYKIDPVITQIKDIVKSQNQISPTDPQAVTVINLAAQFETFNMLFIGIDILIWLVGMGTLLAGIIGVSNIMMVTVKERTREIGVRRALGAKPWNIISQIMSESLLLTALAGLLGLSAGVFLLDLVDKIMSAQPASNGTMMEHPEVSIQIAVAATVILLFSGLLAGLIPAWRAMQIKAIDRKSTRLNSSHTDIDRMPSSA